MRSDQTGYAPYLGVFLRELEDKLEVARMQQQVYIFFKSLIIINSRKRDNKRSN